MQCVQATQRTLPQGNFLGYCEVLVHTILSRLFKASHMCPNVFHIRTGVLLLMLQVFQKQVAGENTVRRYF